ncbi:LuxR C-terminal-related transcriptional regulator [Sphingobacterium sp. Mn56C]|uniref:helix-turn-helix transcriptional regulator n=1 Tax=Sphingobacterium sp. Mn56C TaxID=3395261 RepID=UPI003BC2A968
MRILICSKYEIIEFGLYSLIKELFPASVVFKAKEKWNILEYLKFRSVNFMIISSEIIVKDDEIIDIARLNWPDLKILFIFSMEDQMFIPYYINRGISGFIPHNIYFDHLKQALLQFLRSGKFIPKDYLEKQTPLKTKIESEHLVLPSLNGLSKREIQILNLLVTGAKITHIAKSLKLSNSSISTYKLRILRKLEIKNIADLKIFMNKIFG